MTLRRLSIFISCVVLALGVALAQSATASQSATPQETPHETLNETLHEATPEATVSAFYRWFITRDTKDHIYPLTDAHIFRYVARRTVETLRRQFHNNDLPGDADYFTNVQDFDEDDWLAHTVVGPATFIDDIALVPVTFGSTQKKTDLVFLRKIDGHWKITKVVDTRDYQ